MDIQKILKHSIELLEIRGEDVSEYETGLNNIQINRYYSEVVTRSTKNITVFYIISKDTLFKKWWSDVKMMTAEDMEKTYKTKGFILIMPDYPPSITLQQLQNKHQVLSTTEGFFFHLFLCKELMFNPMKHELVPKHEKITEEEGKTLMENLQLKSKTQIPLIQRTDVIARWLGLSQGDIVRITRYNETSGEYYFYRCCI
jgi:DNA-directed RNA polymerase subunit H (RpoH/RPB5)